jgi:uncharacterized protein DUF1998
MKTDGQIRLSQAVMSFGPGALVDLPSSAGIISGVDEWSIDRKLDQIVEPRLAAKLSAATGVTFPKMYSPPPDSRGESWRDAPGITVWEFPEWFLVQRQKTMKDKQQGRRLVHKSALDKRGFIIEGKRVPVVPIRFVRACERGHVDDIDWKWFVHQEDAGGEAASCSSSELYLVEKGTTGDLGDVEVRCRCGKRRSLADAHEGSRTTLGKCFGKRPWLGGYKTEEACDRPARLLIRTASNAYFSQTISVLSLPTKDENLASAVERCWDHLQVVEELSELKIMLRMQQVAAILEGYSNEEIFEQIEKQKSGGVDEPPVKAAEVRALLAVPTGFGDDTPVDQDFHARKLARDLWDPDLDEICSGIEEVIQMHRLREVLALAGFTRFDPIMPDIHGEFENAENLAEIQREPEWFPAIENRGEGIFLSFAASTLMQWAKRPAVKARLDELTVGHSSWIEQRSSSREFPGGAYLLLHSLSHLLIQSLSMNCGYPASSIRERIYVEDSGAGILLYTATPDAEGTLGGLVQEARHIRKHLREALKLGALCSSDPICSMHSPRESLEERFLHGAACHGCSLIAETSCEMRNEYLDRALVVPTLHTPGAAFFEAQ